MKQNRHSQVKRNVKGKNGVKTTILTPLTPKSAHKLAARSTQAEFAPTIRAAKAEKRASRNQEHRIGQMFGGLQNQIQQSTAATEGAYNTADANMTANIRAAQEAAARNQSNIASQDANFAALTGAAPGSFAQQAQIAGAGAQQRAIAGAALAAPIAAAGASQAAYLRNTGINARREGIQQHMLETKRRKKIGQDITALKQERAGKVADRYLQIRGEEGDRAIQRQAFGLNKQEAGFKQGLEAEENRRANEAQRNENFATHHPNAAGGSSGGLTPNERHTIKKERNERKAAKKAAYQTAVSIAHEGKPIVEHGEVVGHEEWPSWQELETAVRKESEITPAQAHWAVKKLREQKRREAQAKAHRREYEGNPGAPGEAAPHGR